MSIAGAMTGTAVHLPELFSGSPWNTRASFTGPASLNGTAFVAGTFGAATHGGRAAVTPAAGVESAFMPPELDSLSAGELRAVLDAFDEPVSGRSTVGAPGLGDLTDQELERVLRAGEV